LKNFGGGGWEFKFGLKNYEGIYSSLSAWNY